MNQLIPTRLIETLSNRNNRINVKHEKFAWFRILVCCSVRFLTSMLRFLAICRETSSLLFRRTVTAPANSYNSDALTNAPNKRVGRLINHVLAAVGVLCESFACCQHLNLRHSSLLLSLTKKVRARLIRKETP